MYNFLNANYFIYYYFLQQLIKRGIRNRYILKDLIFIRIIITVLLGNFFTKTKIWKNV